MRSWLDCNNFEVRNKELYSHVTMSITFKGIISSLFPKLFPLTDSNQPTGLRTYPPLS